MNERVFLKRLFKRVGIRIFAHITAYINKLFNKAHVRLGGTDIEKSSY